MAKTKKRTKSVTKTTTGTRVKKKGTRVDFDRDDVALAFVKAKVPEAEQQAYAMQIYQNAGISEKSAKSRAYQVMYYIRQYGLKKCAKEGALGSIKQYLPNEISLEERTKTAKTKKSGRKKKADASEEKYEEPAAPEESYDAPDKVSTILNTIDESQSTLSKLITVKGISSTEGKRASELIGNIGKSMDYLTEDADKLKKYVDGLKENYIATKKAELEKQKADFEAQQGKTQAELEAMLQ